MTNQLLPLPEPPQTQRRRGRPPGSGNKRSTDLARYIEATFGGTPGQQAAQLALVTPREVKNARTEAKALGIMDHGLDPVTLAQVVKAWKLARALGCETRDAWMIALKEREALMPYVHQRQAQKAEEKPGAKVATVYMIPDAPDPGALPDMTEADADDLGFAGVSEAG